MISKHSKASECDYCRGFDNADEMLAEASWRGRVECVRHALAEGANVNCSNLTALSSTYLTPLMVASKMGHDDCLNALITAGADVNKNVVYNTRLHCYTADTTLIPLNLAAQGGNDRCLVHLIEAGANVNVRTRGGYTALMYASQTRSHESVNVLIKAEADVNMTNWNHNTALILSVNSGSIECVTHLLAGGADVNHRPDYLLDSAVLSGNLTNVKLLLQAGIPINSRQPWYTTTLREKRNKIMALLNASGEYIREGKTELDLKAQCRSAVRKNLLDLNPQAHLFDRVPRLGLPKLLQRYLLYNVDIYDDCEATFAVGENKNHQVQHDGKV